MQFGSPIVSVSGTINSVATEVVLGSQVVTPGNALNVQVAGSPNYRYIYLAMHSSAANAFPSSVTLVGNQSGIAYAPYYAPYLGNPFGIRPLYIFRVLAAVDTSYSLSTSVVGGVGNNVTFYWGAGSDNIDALISDNMIPINTVDYGGQFEAQGTISSTTLTQILATPQNGQAYRLHSLCATTTTQNVELVGTTQPFAVVTSPDVRTLNGMLVTTAISIKASGVTTMAYVLRYDVVNLPSIQ